MSTKSSTNKDDKKMWTRFSDMNSGGTQKLEWELIFIEAGEEESKVIFYNRFGRNPQCVTCTCCGEDYAIEEDESLYQATAFHRGCMHDSLLSKYIEQQSEHRLCGQYRTPTEFIRDKSVLIIPAEKIRDDERRGDVPEQGYIWR